MNSLTLTAFKSHSNRWHLSFIQRFNCYISILTHPWRATSMISNLSVVILVWHDVTWPQQIWHECHNTSNCHQTDITTLLANIKSIYKQTLYSIHVILQTHQLFASPQYCKLHPITDFRLSFCIFILRYLTSPCVPAAFPILGILLSKHCETPLM